MEREADEVGSDQAVVNADLCKIVKKIRPDSPDVTRAAKRFEKARQEQIARMMSGPARPWDKIVERDEEEEEEEEEEAEAEAEGRRETNELQKEIERRAREGQLGAISKTVHYSQRWAVRKK